MKLLLLNAFKGLKKKKVQMLGIIVMVLLSTGIYTCMNTAIDRLEDRYYNYLEDQNVENISYEVLLDYNSDLTETDLNEIINQYKFSEEELGLIEQYREYIKVPHEVSNLNLVTMIQNLFQSKRIDIELKSKKLDKIKDKYDFTYEAQSSKTLNSGKVTMAIKPYSDAQLMNKPYLIEGRLPKNEGEITMLPSFAKSHNLKVGDKYELNGINYTIVGFTYASDYIYPLISFSVPIFDEDTNNIIYMNESSYQNVKGLEETIFSIRYNYEVDRKFEFTFDEEDSSVENTILKEEKDNIAMSMSTITRIGRISALQLEFATNRLFAQYFLYLLLGVSVIIILVITKKRIDDERLQIGVLKSLGYNRFSIAASYLVYPIIGSIIGGILGYLLGTAFHLPLTTIYLSFYNVPLSNFHLDLGYLITSIIVPMLVLSILSYFIAFVMLRKKPLQLLKEGSNLKVNFFSKIVNKITSFFPFYSRFKYALASRSLGKLFIVTITSFCTGLLVVLVLIGANLFNSLIETSFKGMKYDYMVSLNTVSMDELNEKSDAALSAQFEVKQLLDSKGNKKELKKQEDELQIGVTGIDIETYYIEVLDKEEKKLNHLLKDENGIIINQNLKEVYGIDLGDTIIFTFNNQEITYKVIAISEEYMSLSAYVSRSGLSSKLGLSKSAYNMIYSNDSKYADGNESKNIAMVISFNDLKENIMKQMDRYNGSIYIVIFFAAFMAFVIIAVIANIVVEENKKTISLMKVMGYQNKTISKVVLNIYTPVIIIAYLLAIPIMISVLKFIVTSLVGDMDMVIPITLSPWMAILGLVALLVGYYIAVAISRRVLNKVPLSVALKRE